MIKNALLSLVAITTIASCASGPPTRNVIGLPINKVISSKHSPNVALLDGGAKQYTVENRIEPYPSADSCTPAVKAGDPPDCVPGIGMDGSDTTTIYTVDAKGIITDVTQSSEFIPYSGPSPGWSAVKPEEPPAPEYTPEQDESINDFFNSVHKQ